MKTERLGTKIRAERQKSGFTLKEFDKRLRISLITLQGIETGNSGPSAPLLSEIAHPLNKSIFSLLEEQKEKSFISFMPKSQQIISSPALR
jgi:transcriptional regulator with XRE-family HTH domain